MQPTPELRQALIRAAIALWGQPTKKGKLEWRFGRLQSKSIDLEKLVWRDHEADEGAGVLELCKRAGIDPPPAEAPPEIAYPYHDANGKLLKEVVRRPGHKFVQRRPNHNGGWIWDTKGVEDTPYRLPELLAAHSDEEVFLVEGEKDVDNVRRLGLVASCNAGGAGKWSAALNKWFHDRDIVILPDNDEPGRKHATGVAEQLTPIARSVRIVALPDLPEKGDVSDWIGQGGTRDALLELLDAQAPHPGGLPWIPPHQDGVEPPPREWVVRDIIPNRQVVLFSGEGAAGKSLTAAHLVCAMNVGASWLHYDPTPGAAWLIDCEEDADESWRRIDTIRTYLGTTYAALYAGGLRVMNPLDGLLARPGKDGVLVPTPLYLALLAEASRVKPKLIALASLANIYGGVENDRAQVQQFVALLRKLAIAMNGAVLVISHPSLTGITSGTGLSGSTQWHNGVRARIVLKGIRAEDNGTEPVGDLRKLEFHKNQYGAPAQSLTLRWNPQHHLFLPEGSGDSLDKLAKEARADEVFLTILRRRNDQKRPVSDNPMATYAPRVFAGEPEALAAHLSRRDLELAMERLFRGNKIVVMEWGPTSKRRKFIDLV